MATRAKAQRGNLSRQAVVDAGLALADAEGLEALSIRRLASDLGVTPMALYRYVSNKAELISAVGDRAFEDIELPADLGARWQDQLRTLAHAFRRVLLAHPGIATNQWANTGALSVGGMAVVEVVLGVLSSAGFGIRESALLEARLERFVVALVVIEIEGSAGSDPVAREGYQRENRARLAALSPEHFPHVSAAADWLCSDPTPEWAFEVALDLLIGGLEQLLADPDRRSLHGT
jgi:AcrR family transcriptional regulator